MTAAGSGCMAALAAERYLNENDLLQEFHQRQVRPTPAAALSRCILYVHKPTNQTPAILCPESQAKAPFNGTGFMLCQHSDLACLAPCCDACVRGSKIGVKA